MFVYYYKYKENKNVNRNLCILLFNFSIKVVQKLKIMAYVEDLLLLLNSALKVTLKNYRTLY